MRVKMSQVLQLWEKKSVPVIAAAKMIVIQLDQSHLFQASHPLSPEDSASLHYLLCIFIFIFLLPNFWNHFRILLCLIHFHISYCQQSHIFYKTKSYLWIACNALCDDGKTSLSSLNVFVRRWSHPRSLQMCSSITNEISESHQTAIISCSTWSK